MQFDCCLILSLLAITNGSPYYYREDKHHSEHHKEYSYSNSQPSLSAYETSPQKYIETSHFSSHAAPERYYKLETNPSFSTGFSQYSGGGQSAFHQREFQSSGLQSSHLSPLLTGQSMNTGVTPGTYVIKQVKIYRQPTSYTGFYGTSNVDGRGQETGQQEEDLYASQHEMNTQTGQHVKQVQTSLYHQLPHGHSTLTQDESLFGQKQINEEDFSQIGQQQISGQKEDCNYNDHLENYEPVPQRGDLDIGQKEEVLGLSTQHSQTVKTLEKTPFDDNNKGYKYYEKRITTYGSPEKETNVYQQTYAHHTQMLGRTDIGGKDIEKFQDILSEPTTVKTINGFENLQTGSRQESNHASYSKETVKLEKKIQPTKPQTYYNNPVFIHVPEGQQIYSGSLEDGKHEENRYSQSSLNLGQQLVPSSLEVGQQPDSITGQQLETGSFEVGQNVENFKGKHDHTWERQINTSTVEMKGSRNGPKLPFKHHLRTEHLEIGPISNSKPHIQITKNITRTVIVGHDIPTKSLQNGPYGQIPEAISGQNVETGFFEIGQKEENMGQLETSDLGAGQHAENLGQLETGTLGIGQHEDVGQLETSDLGISQHEDNMGQLETGDLGMSQHEVKLEIGKDSDLGQHTEQEVMTNNNKFDLGQKEETSFDFELSKSTFPVKLTATPTKTPNYNEHTSYVKTYNQHESHYKEVKHTANSNPIDIPVNNQKYDSAIPRNYDKESININKNTDYLKLQQKAEELALQLGLEDISKQKSSQQGSYEDKFVNKNTETTSASKVHATEIQEHSIAKHHTLGKATLIPNKKITTWEAHKEEYGLKYPLSSQGYAKESMSQNYGGYQGQSQHSSHYGGYRQGYLVSGDKAYYSDQPIQRTHTSGSQFSFSGSSGSSQDRHKVIDDFLKELDKDIAITNHQQRQQGSYAAMAESRPINSGTNYYSQRTVSTHSNSSYSSSGMVPEGTTGKAWYQRIGDSIGSGYNQAKEKAKDIVKTVKQSVGYSSS